MRLFHLHVIAGEDTCPGANNSSPEIMLIEVRKFELCGHLPPVVSAVSFLRDCDDISFLETQITGLISIKSEECHRFVVPQAASLALGQRRLRKRWRSVQQLLDGSC